jgi:hypothetical protein
MTRSHSLLNERYFSSAHRIDRHKRQVKSEDWLSGFWLFSRLPSFWDHFDKVLLSVVDLELVFDASLGQ